MVSEDGERAEGGVRDGGDGGGLFDPCAAGGVLPGAVDDIAGEGDEVGLDAFEGAGEAVHPGGCWAGGCRAGGGGVTRQSSYQPPHEAGFGVGIGEVEDSEAIEGWGEVGKGDVERLEHAPALRVVTRLVAPGMGPGGTRGASAGESVEDG